ncbi:MAG: phosphodiesterase [Burkholderiaceae bacterium]
MSEPTHLVQISDPHITRRGTRLLGRVDTGAALQRAVTRITRLPLALTAVVVTGDLSAAGEAEEYAELRRLLEPLRVPVHLLAGNHDDRARLRAAFPVAGAVTGTGPRHYAVAVGDLRLIALDTSMAGRPDGELGPAQLQWLDAELGRHADRPTVIAMHHPPFDGGMAAMDAMGLGAGRTELEAIVRRHPQVERVICGHLHRPIVRRFGRTVAQTAPAMAHQMELQFDPAQPLGFVMEPPALLIHRWTAAAGLVSHSLPIEAAPGPYPFD